MLALVIYNIQFTYVCSVIGGVTNQQNSGVWPLKAVLAVFFKPAHMKIGPPLYKKKKKLQKRRGEISQNQ